MFRAAGYATCIADKWQSGSKDAALPKHFGGAEHCLWSLLGRGERYAEPSLSANGAFKTFAGKSRPDLGQDFVGDFIRRNRRQPFLVYYPMILTHGPYALTPDSKDDGPPGARATTSRRRGRRRPISRPSPTGWPKQVIAVSPEIVHAIPPLSHASPHLVFFTS